MRKITLLVFAFTQLGFYVLNTTAQAETSKQTKTITTTDFYQLNYKTLEGKPFAFKDLKGKAILFVNTASQCGFTPQLKEIEDLHQKYSKKGLVILAVPSNDFKQEKPISEEILSFAKKEYKVSFTFLEKQKITGVEKTDLFKYLTEAKTNLLLKEVKWNFEKFLVDRQGQVVERWSSPTKPSSDSITQKIESVL